MRTNTEANTPIKHVRRQARLPELLAVLLQIALRITSKLVGKAGNPDAHHRFPESNATMKTSILSKRQS
jgi:hypothetical protein